MKANHHIHNKTKMEKLIGWDKEWQSLANYHHGQRELNVETWFSGHLGSAGLMVGIHSLKGIFQSKSLYESRKLVEIVSSKFHFLHKFCSFIFFFVLVVLVFFSPVFFIPRYMLDWFHFGGQVLHSLLLSKALPPKQVFKCIWV